MHDFARFEVERLTGHKVNTAIYFRTLVSLELSPGISLLGQLKFHLSSQVSDP